MCPGNQGLGSGAPRLGGKSLTFTSGWGELYLGLWSLLGLYGRAGHGKDCWMTKCVSGGT